MTTPLGGTRVLDLGRIIAGPFCAMLLADIGAEVIKVENIEGENSRQFTPLMDGLSLYFATHNRGKKSITLNMRSDEAKEIFCKLVKISDVIVENFRPGVMAEMGFDYPRLSAIKPGIVLTSVSGFGQSGPYSRRVAMDSVIQAMSGMWASTGYPDGPPTRIGGNPVDYTAGLYAAFCTLAALNQRHRTGRGQHVDLSMFDCMVSFLSLQIMNYLASGKDPGRWGNASFTAAPSNLYQAKDGYILILGALDAQFARLLDAMKRSDLHEDPRLKTRAARLQNRELVDDLIQQWVATKTVQEASSELEAASVPNGPLQTIPQVASDPHVQARHLLQEVEVPAVGKIPVPGVVANFSEFPAPAPRRPAFLGEHNQEIYGGLLGYSEAERARLQAEGVI